MASTATSYLPDDEEERRRAEVEALVGGFGADLAAGMRAGGIDIDAPQPGDPRGEQPSPMAHADAPMPQRAPMPVAPTASMARGVTQQAAPAPAQRLTPRQELPQLPPDMSRTYQQQIDDLDGQQRREQRRRGIIGSILGLIGGGRGGSQFVDGFVNQHAGAYDQRRQRVAQMMAANQEQRAQAERARAEMRQRAVQQGNADRDYELRRSGQALIDEDRDAMRAQQREIFGLREAQDLQQDAARAQAAAGRTRDMAGAISGRPPRESGIVRPGAATSDSGGADMSGMLDAPIVQAMIENRPEILQAARAEASRRQAAGEDADPNQIAWELASGLFRRLPRDEQDRVRRAYITPESTNTAITAPARAEQQMATRVRQYGSEARDRIEWERAVDTAGQALSGVSDAELRAAQQWIQGGAARQSIAANVAPRAEQIGEAISTLQNIMLRERSGAAVTDQEFQRLRGELGSNWWSSPDSLRRAIGRMRATNDAIREGLGAEYGIDVVEAYEANRQAVRNRGGGSQGPGGGAERVIGARTINGQRVEMVQRADGSRYVRPAGGQ